MSQPKSQAATTLTTNTSSRQPYHGSCHCGLIKYMVWLTLPPAAKPISSLSDAASTVTRVRKCNCSTCHKMGFFHVRVPNSPKDFALISPIITPENAGQKEESILNGIKLDTGKTQGIRDYTCFEQRIHWLFCGRCGVRCFAFSGQGCLCALSLPSLSSASSIGSSEETVVWSPKAENWVEGGHDEQGNFCYLSINAMTLEQGQEGLDLREWHENGSIVYLDIRTDKAGRSGDRFSKPFEGGMY